MIEYLHWIHELPRLGWTVHPLWCTLPQWGWPCDHFWMIWWNIKPSKTMIWLNGWAHDFSGDEKHGLPLLELLENAPRHFQKMVCHSWWLIILITAWIWFAFGSWDIFLGCRCPCTHVTYLSRRVDHRRTEASGLQSEARWINDVSTTFYGDKVPSTAINNHQHPSHYHQQPHCHWQHLQHMILRIFDPELLPTLESL